jgi:hypothetical protein
MTMYTEQVGLDRGILRGVVATCLNTLMCIWLSGLGLVVDIPLLLEVIIFMTACVPCTKCSSTIPACVTLFVGLQLCTGMLTT